MNTGTVRTGLITTAVLLVAIPIFIIVLLSDDSGDTCAGPELGQGDFGANGLTLAGMDPGQLQIARLAISVGEQRGIAESGILAALMAAATESTMRNDANSSVPESTLVPHDAVGNDHDSVGPWQMRVSVWGHRYGGTNALMQPKTQANWFYDEVVKIPGWQTKDPATLAQDVEGSDYPDRYARNSALAQQLYHQFVGTAGNSAGLACVDVPTAPPVPDNNTGSDVLAKGMRWLGEPYVWGGGNQYGPTDGGMDCSGLVLAAVAAASDGRIILPHNTDAQLADPRGTPIPIQDVQPGDAVYFTTPGDTGSHHVGIFAGTRNGVPMILNAPTFGQDVKIEPLSDWSQDRKDVRRFNIGSPCRFSCLIAPSHQSCADSAPAQNQCESSGVPSGFSASSGGGSVP